VLRFAVLAVAALWTVATIGRFAARLSRTRAAPIRGALPAPPPEPRPDRLIGVLRIVLGAILVIAFAAVLLVLTDLPDLLVLVLTAPVAGLVSSLVTEWFVTEDDG
jgi:hypothetical protein